MKNMLVLMLTSFLVGCISSNVIVRIPMQQHLSSVQSAQRVTVEIRDLRAPGVAASTRQAAFGTPMGNVIFDPSEKKLVQNALEVALSQQSQLTGLYICEILEFGVNTDTTPIYWDVVGVVRLKLKHDEHEYDLSGSYTERTYLWPGEEILGRVMQESLQKAVERLFFIAK